MQIEQTTAIDVPAVSLVDLHGEHSEPSPSGGRPPPQQTLRVLTLCQHCPGRKCLGENFHFLLAEVDARVASMSDRIVSPLGVCAAI
jgi:hypothetical protein